MQLKHLSTWGPEDHSSRSLPSLLLVVYLA